MRPVLLVLVLLSGCFGYVKPTENQKQLHQQTIGAAQVAADKSTDPEGKQAAIDAKQSAETTQDTLIGAPKVKEAYTHEAAVKYITVVKKEYDESQAPWYKRWAGTLLGGLGTLALLAVGAARYFPATAAIANIIYPIAQHIVGVKQAADANTAPGAEDTIHLDEIQKKVTALTKVPVIGPILEKGLAKAHMEALVHSPEGSEPAVA